MTPREPKKPNEPPAKQTRRKPRATKRTSSAKKPASPASLAKKKLAEKLTKKSIPVPPEGPPDLLAGETPPNIPSPPESVPLPPKPPPIDIPELPPILNLDSTKVLGNPPYKILSMDGGGIYGLNTALMLRHLCTKVKDFLSPHEGQKYFFAGTSAGSINALLLAAEENPRDAVLSGKLERFWRQPGIYSNRVNPVNSFLSWFGITAWLGTEDFLMLLEDTFGVKKLGDLKHNILITTFNWSGSRNATSDHQWRPKLFYNFPNGEPDRECFIRDVAYAAASPPPLRAVRDGYGDGGVFSPNPADNALAKVMHIVLYRGTSHRLLRDQDRSRNGLLEIVANLQSAKERTQELERLRHLGMVSLLSVGVGYNKPCYQSTAFNYGNTLFNIMPTNPTSHHMFSPNVSISLDAPGQISQYKTELILGNQSFRLDPPILNPPTFPPTLIATSMCRFDYWREFFASEIEKRVKSDEAKAYLDKAVAFIDSDRWRNPSRA